MPPPTLIAHAAVVTGTVGTNIDGLRRRAGTAVGAYRTRGLAGVLVAMAGRLPRRLIQVEWYSVHERLTVGDSSLPPWPSARRAGLGDAVELAAIRQAPDDEIRERLELGDRAYLAHDEDQPVGHVWYRAGSWREGGIQFALADDERWGYDSFVRPTHRGRGIAPALAVHALDDLRAGGVRRVVSVIDHLNTASRRAATRYGARPVCSIVTIAVPGFEFVREHSTGAARSSWTGHRRTRPLVRRPPTSFRPTPPPS